jgi:hypothetical protein
MRLRLPSLTLAAALVLAASTLAGSAAAQTADGVDAPAGPGEAGGRGMHRGMARGERRAPLDPVVLNGPPAPAEFAQIVELPEDKVGGYGQLYERFMTSTRPQRDSLAALRGSLRQAMENRDRDAAQRQHALVRPLAEDLERRQAVFDDTLRPMVTKEQWKRYDHWRDRERKRAEEERGAMRRRRAPS